MHGLLVVLGGAGLGLQISKSIIEHHGGEIGFKSQAGNGAEFYWTLPLDVVAPASASAAAAAASIGVPAMRTIKIGDPVVATAIDDDRDDPADPAAAARQAEEIEYERSLCASLQHDKRSIQRQHQIQPDTERASQRWRSSDSASSSPLARVRRLSLDVLETGGLIAAGKDGPIDRPHRRFASARSSPRRRDSVSISASNGRIVFHNEPSWTGTERRSVATEVLSDSPKLQSLHVGGSLGLPSSLTNAPAQAPLIVPEEASKGLDNSQASAIAPTPAVVFSRHSMDESASQPSLGTQAASFAVPLDAPHRVRRLGATTKATRKAPSASAAGRVAHPVAFVPAAVTARAPRILVVEDSPPNRKLLMSLLTALGCEVTGANDGQYCCDLFEPYIASRNAVQAAQRAAAVTAAAAQSEASRGDADVGRSAELNNIAITIRSHDDDVPSDKHTSDAASTASLPRSPPLALSLPSQPLYERLVSVDAPSMLRGASMGVSSPAVASTAASGVQNNGSVSLVDFPFDLCLLDNSMPRMTGVEATRWLRSQGITSAQLPIIGCTGNALQEDVDTFLAAGAAHICTKPINRAKIVAALQRYLPAHLASQIRSTGHARK